MEIYQRLENLNENFGCFLFVHWSVGVNVVEQFAIWAHLHENKKMRCSLYNLIKSDDILMDQFSMNIDLIPDSHNHFRSIMPDI